MIPENTAPYFAGGLRDITVFAGEEIEYLTGAQYDPDGDVVWASVTQKGSSTPKSWLTGVILDETQQVLFYLAPTEEDVGLSYLDVTLSDLIDQTSYKIFITIEEPEKELVEEDIPVYE